MSAPVDKPVDTVDNSVVYLRYRVTEMFDKGATKTPRWTMTDARHVRRVLDALEVVPMALQLIADEGKEPS